MSIRRTLIANGTLEVAVQTTNHFERRSLECEGCNYNEDRQYSNRLRWYTQVMVINGHAVPDILGRMLGEFLEDKLIELDWE